MSQITVCTEIAAPIDAVFAFHLDPRNAARISPRGTRVVSVEAPERVPPATRSASPCGSSRCR